MDKTSNVNYEKSLEYKTEILKESYIKFKELKRLKELDIFIENNNWVVGYAIYSILYNKNNKTHWQIWNKTDKNYALKNGCPKGYEDDYYFLIFGQMIAYNQYKKLKKYANKKGIKIIADCPFYVGNDSADCFFNKDKFLFDKKFNPIYVSGVTPDYFNENGQIWGTPIYNFEKMKDDNYTFLINRILHLLSISDFLRLDHFRAFDTYCVIPYGDETAKRGEWLIGPREDFFNILYKKKANIKLIAEDLGDIFKSVHELRDFYNLPGMYVTQFMIFDGSEHSNYNQVVYSATHDNQTVVGWLKTLSREEKKVLQNKFNNKDLYQGFMKYTWNLPSNITIIPLQDLLKLDDKSRLNTPGTMGSPNWEWKLKDIKMLKKVKFGY